MQPQLQPDEYEQLDDKEKVGAEKPELTVHKGGNQVDSKPGGKSTGSLRTAVGGKSPSAAAAKRAGGGAKMPSPGRAGGVSSLPGGGGAPPVGAAGVAARIGSSIAGAFSGGSGKRNAAIGGGVGIAIMAMVLALFFAFSQLKLIHLMENIEKHFFSRNQHMYEMRREAYMRKFFNDYLGNNNAAIDDSTATFSQQVMRRLHDGLEPRLREKYKIEVRSHPSRPGYKIVTFTDKATGEVTVFDTSTNRSQARQFARSVSTDITHDDNWMKRIWYRRRITDITNTHWHWLDPIKQPYNRAKVAAANQLAKFLMSSDSPAAAIGKTLLTKIFGDGSDAGNRVQEALDSAVSSETEQFVARAIVEKAASVGSVVGVALVATDLYCNINDILQDGKFQKLVRQKSEIEYMTAYADWRSKADQFKKMATDGPTLGASMELMTYTDKNGRQHDFTESNNYQRAAGKQVGYKPTNDCDSSTELCNLKTPPEMASKGAVLGTLDFLKGLLNSPTYKAFANTIPMPVLGNAETSLVCTAYRNTVGPALKFGAGAADTVLSHIPLFKDAWGWFKDKSADIASSLSTTIVSLFVAPVVDSSTRGPLLAHAITAGASMDAASIAGASVGTQDEMCADKSDSDKASDSSMCGHKLTAAQARQQDEVIAMEQYDDYKSLPFDQKMIALDNPNSLLSRVLDATPSSPNTAVQNGVTQIASTINPSQWPKIGDSLLALFTRPALASSGSTFIVKDDGTDQFGTDIVGLTEEELAKDVDSDPKLKNIDRNTGCSMVAGLKGSDGKVMDLPDECANFLLDQTSASDAATGAPADADFDVSKIFESSTSIPCADNTKDLGVQDGYHAGQKVKIRICAVSNFPGHGDESGGAFGVSGADGKTVVNSRVSGAVYAMVKAAKDDGIDLTSDSAFRTMAHQQALCPCDGVNVAVPGTSNHQMGLAIDFTGIPKSPGGAPGNKFWDWLDKNASKFKYKPYANESWHWSPTGN